MQYSMAELVKQTDVPKSTILYYIKEGLLPEAKKIKPNVHKYNQEHINLLKYIKYMQNDINCSISQIKKLIKDEQNKLNSSKSMLLPLVDAYIGLTQDKNYTKEEILTITGITKSKLDQLLKEKILFPLNENSFTKREIDIINLIKEYDKLDINYDILLKYSSLAQEIIKIEKQMQDLICQKCEDNDINNNKNLWNIAFETFFKSKQYILNQHSYIAFLKKFKQEVNNIN